MLCKICGAQLRDGVYHVSYGPPLSPDEMYTRVCQYARGCTNRGKIVENKLYPSELEKTPDFVEDLARKYAKTNKNG